MDKNEFKRKMASCLRIPGERVKDEVVLTELVADSFALVDMVVELQEEFGARLTQDNLKDVRTVNDLFLQFDSQLRNKNQS